MPFSAKRCRVLGHAERFEPVRNLLHRGPPRRSYRGLTALLDQGDREVFRQFPGTVHRLTEPAKQVSLALLRGTEVSPPTVELGQSLPIDLARTMSALPPTAEVSLRRGKRRDGPEH